ncbi:HAD family hydrolase [Sphingomonas sp. KR1UV-12]|uniref:HAD family hydrolase n=1 Tax=Sphingomonas aurea TaxID=3063994 RepID=A0ABT9EKU5_9SPHN|nr:HAD family hydrolase [Sphingomonas sp. KR1UV-12]MDP1027595.1 HAD family hydrolase [Sphingomonas sp. KR1UV-12]
MHIKAVLFDIDGTLVDSNEQHVTVWDAVLRQEGKACARRTIHDQIGKGADMLIPTLVPDADDALCDRLAEAHGTMFKERFLDGVRPFAKARDLLARVHAAGQRVVLASSASAEELDHYLELLGARDLVAATTSADDVGNTKPAPDIFATALDKVAPLTSAEVMVVGDTPYDMEAAARCGIAAIAVRSGGFDDAALTEAGARYIYDDVAALYADYERSPLVR